ncbi:Mediator of RNA polymerase II transcription subunit 11 [Spathaspora sp. JA1]|nr:Mediator of RNA polymerase II transcription subunit 11 [Spathaspora sp. JA1]
MSLEDEKADTFIQERLDALYDVDCKVVSLLDNLSSLFQTYSNDNIDNIKTQFPKQTSEIYGILSKVAIDLRKEVKIMDDNIGVYDKNKDGISILPISVEQKNTQLGMKRLNMEVKELDKLLEKEQQLEQEQKQQEEHEQPEQEPQPELEEPELEDVEMIIPEEIKPQESMDNVIDKLENDVDDLF